MRKINSPGNVSNQFVDYDPVNNPLGTVYSADFGNDVQGDLIAIQEFAGLPEAAASAKNVLKSIIRISIEQGKRIGERFFLDTYIPFSGFVSTNETTAQDYFPAICLSAIESHLDIAVANWPLLVPHLRARQVRYLENLPGAVSDFTCTVAGSVITLANNTANNALLLALSKMVLDRGGYTNFISITVAGVEFPLTNVNTTTRQLTVTGTPSAAATTCQIFPHRITGSTTTARLYSARGKGLISANDAAGLFINGMSLLGYFQGHDRYTGLSMQNNAPFIYGQTLEAPGIATSIVAATTGTGDRQAITSPPRNNGTDGTPRTSSETHGPAQVQHMYIWGRRYVP